MITAKNWLPSVAAADLVKRTGGKHVVGQLWQSGVCCRVRRGADDKRIDVARIVNFASLGGIEEDAIAAANHGFVTQPIGETKPGSKRLLRASGGIVAAAIPVKTVAVGRDRTTQSGDVRSTQRFVGVAQSPSRIGAIKPEHLVVLLRKARCGSPSEDPDSR